MDIGEVFFFNISPQVGYQFGEQFRLNGGIEYYNYNRSPRNFDATDSAITPFVNVQYLVFNAIFGQVQFQHSKYNRKFSDGFEESDSEDGLLIGIGYAGGLFKDGFDYNLVISYNVLFEDIPNAINFFPSPIVPQAVLTYKF